MNIIGIGTDAADIGRVQRLYQKYPHFAERCFTEAERNYAHRFARPARRLAARFAGKEAVMKSMGIGWRRIRWKDIEITGGGAPQVILFGTARQRADRLGISRVLVSITHTDNLALVQAIAVNDHLPEPTYY